MPKPIDSLPTLGDMLQVPSAASDAVIAATHPSPAEGGPCATCAFRLGTEPNRAVYTTALARLCVEGIEPFHCHERPQHCRGWNAAVNLRGAPVDEDDRRWMIVAREAAEILARCIAAAAAVDRTHHSRGDQRRTLPEIA